MGEGGGRWDSEGMWRWSSEKGGGDGRVNVHAGSSTHRTERPLNFNSIAYLHIMNLGGVRVEIAPTEISK